MKDFHALADDNLSAAGIHTQAPAQAWPPAVQQMMENISFVMQLHPYCLHHGGLLHTVLQGLCWLRLAGQH